VIDLRDFVTAVVEIVGRHRLDGPGRYVCRLEQDGSASRGIDAYGCADAVNLLYTADRWPAAGERQAMATELGALQDPMSGLFRDPTHDPLHTTAHVLGALDLLEAGPSYRLSALDAQATPAALEAFLESLDWVWSPWREAHKGAGLYAARVLAGEASAPWVARYFAWLWEEADPETGLWRRGRIAEGGDALLFHHLAGSFHYLFNHEHAQRPLRYPERVVDSCLRILREDLFPPLCHTVGYAELDWIYCLSRSSRQSGHRLTEARHALAEVGDRYAAFVLSLDPEHDAGLNDLHRLLGSLSAFAELQSAVPRLVLTEHPLRLVLDRRPFI
jgi:hypothetical protein